MTTEEKIERAKKLDARVGEDVYFVSDGQTGPMPDKHQAFGGSGGGVKAVTVKIDASDLEPLLEKRLAPVQKAHKLALDLLRDLPARLLDASLRARVLEVERALVEAIKPETASDAKPKLGDACAAMVAAYDD